MREEVKGKGKGRQVESPPSLPCSSASPLLRRRPFPPPGPSISRPHAPSSSRASPSSAVPRLTISSASAGVAGRRRLTISSAPSYPPPRGRRRLTFSGAPPSAGDRGLLKMQKEEVKGKGKGRQVESPPSFPCSLHLLSDEMETKRKEELELLFRGKEMGLLYEGLCQSGKVLRLDTRSLSRLMILLNKEEKVEAATKGLVVQAYGCRKSKIHSVIISITDQLTVFGGEGWNDLMYVNDAEERMHLRIFGGREDSHLKLGVYRFRST